MKKFFIIVSICFLVVSCFGQSEVPSIPRGSGTGASGGGISRSGLFEVFDDFERTISFGQGIIGTADTGQTWGNRGSSTNAAMTTTGLNGRRLTYGSNAPGAFYIWATNSSGFAPKYWTHFGGKVSFENINNGNGLADLLTIIVADDHNFSGNFLHITLGYNAFGVQRGLGSYFGYWGSPLTYLDPSGVNSNRQWDYSITIVSNTFMARVGPYKYQFQADDLHQYAAKPVILWEINGSATNQIRGYWESVYAGYANEADVWTVLNPVNWYGMTNWAGTGGALTNFTLLADYPYQFISVTTNVSIRAVMNYLTQGFVKQRWTLWATNMSGADRTLEFSAVTNRYRFFSSMYGTNAPTIITNNTAISLEADQYGTNIFLEYKYFALP